MAESEAKWRLGSRIVNSCLWLTAPVIFWEFFFGNFFLPAISLGEKKRESTSRVRPPRMLACRNGLGNAGGGAQR